MSNNIHIKRRQKARKKTFLTPRFIISILLLSIIMAGGVYLEFKDITNAMCSGDCESTYSFFTWALSGLLLLLAVIAVSFVTGSLLSFLRTRSNKNSYSALFEEEEEG